MAGVGNSYYVIRSQKNYTLLEENILDETTVDDDDILYPNIDTIIYLQIVFDTF